LQHRCRCAIATDDDIVLSDDRIICDDGGGARDGAIGDGVTGDFACGLDFSQFGIGDVCPRGDIDVGDGSVTDLSCGDGV